MDVSIVMLVYNHDRFLAQALDSVLMQQTEYEYELIVGEDRSPDGSREILKSYEPRFGGKLKPIYRDKNLGSMRNLLDCLSKCTGRYIAFLEGDDYWTDPEKLQKQISFLDAHPEYSCVSHDWEIVDKDGNLIRHGLDGVERTEYGLENLMDFALPYQTGAIIARNAFREIWKENKKLFLKYIWIPADRTCMALILKRGKLAIVHETMSAYRYYIEAGGTNWSSQNEIQAKQNFIKFYRMELGMEKFLNDLGVPLDLLEARLQEFWKARGCMSREPERKREMQMQCFIMVLFEPHKIRFLKRCLEHRAMLRGK